VPPSPGASPSSASSAGSARGVGAGGGSSAAGSAGVRPRDDGVHYLTSEELQPFAHNPEDKFIADVLRRLGLAGDWSEQFGAITDMRRLTRYAPKALAMGGHLRKTAASITTLIDSLRSALAKNALRCMDELFATFGKRMDAEIETSLPVMMKRAADTNAFIAEEAECTLREVCKVATEAKLLGPLMTACANRQPRIREKALWCVAMLTQRLRLRGPGGHGREQDQLRSVADATNKALGDANAEVRHSARVAATAIIACSGTLLDECMIGTRVVSAVIPGIDPLEFDFFDPVRCAELARMAGLSSTPATGLRNVRSAGAVSR